MFDIKSWSFRLCLWITENTSTVDRANTVALVELQYHWRSRWFQARKISSKMSKLVLWLTTVQFRCSSVSSSCCYLFWEIIITNYDYFSCWLTYLSNWSPKLVERSSGSVSYKSVNCNVRRYPFLNKSIVQVNSRTDSELAVSRGLDSNFRRTDSIVVVQIHLRFVLLQNETVKRN